MSDPYPKEKQLARGERRYRRKVASPKQWQAIIQAKRGPCRVCGYGGRPDYELFMYGGREYHHIVSRAHGGDDVADNIVPTHQSCHADVTRRFRPAVEALLGNLTDAEYAYMIERGGEDSPERAYGIEYSR